MNATITSDKRKHGGFTLLEAVIVIVITGILSVVVARFLKTPVDGYFDSARRAELTDIGDTALRRISRDLHLAVPNTVRVTVVGAVSYLEFLQSTTGGYYRSACSIDPCPVGENPLVFSATDTGFDVLGGLPPAPAPQPVAGNLVVIFNQGGPNYNAYNADNTAVIASATANSITFAAKKFPADSPSQNFQVIDTPVTYVCSPSSSGGDGTGTLTRITGYAISLAQATPPVGTSTQLVGKVSTCVITQPENLPQSGYALVTIRLGVQSSNETVTMYQEAQINNVP